MTDRPFRDQLKHEIQTELHSDLDERRKFGPPVRERGQGYDLSNEHEGVFEDLNIGKRQDDPSFGQNPSLLQAQQKEEFRQGDLGRAPPRVLTREEQVRGIGGQGVAGQNIERDLGHGKFIAADQQDIAADQPSTFGRQEPFIGQQQGFGHKDTFGQKHKVEPLIGHEISGQQPSTFGQQSTFGGQPSTFGGQQSTFGGQQQGAFGQNVGQFDTQGQAWNRSDPVVHDVTIVDKPPTVVQIQPVVEKQAPLSKESEAGRLESPVQGLHGQRNMPTSQI
jgi:hypothetical protein